MQISPLLQHCGVKQPARSLNHFAHSLRPVLQALRLNFQGDNVDVEAQHVQDWGGQDASNVHRAWGLCQGSMAVRFPNTVLIREERAFTALLQAFLQQGT